MRAFHCRIVVLAVVDVIVVVCRQGFVVEVAPRAQAGTHQLFNLEEDVPPPARSNKKGKGGVGEASGVLPTPTATLADVDATMAAALAFRTNHLFGGRLARAPVGATASMRKRKQQAFGGALATKFTR
ncbi:hypothetical protein EON67_11090 [archaeon]|nr:MAG: hypothetical protein EON67_11090 [archaeon]